MKRKLKRRLGRLLTEALLIFSSLIAAFYVENVREDNQTVRNYVGTLLAFRNAIHSNLWYIRQDYDSAIIHNHGFIGLTPLQQQDSALIKVDSMLAASSSPVHVIRALSGLPDLIWDKVDFPTPIADHLLTFSEYLIRDTLIDAITSYQADIEYDFYSISRYNKELTRLHDYLDTKLDWKSTALEEKSLNLVLIKNSVNRLIQHNRTAIGDKEYLASDLSRIVRKLDAVLARYKVDIASLQSDNLAAISR